MSNLPQVQGLDIRNIQIYLYPSFTFRLQEKTIAGFTDGLDAVKQAVFHILSTERYAYPIYADNYGIELQQFFGKSFGFIEANIGNVISNALSQDDRITKVDIVGIHQESLNTVSVEFTVTSDLGTFSREVVLNV